MRTSSGRSPTSLAWRSVSSTPIRSRHAPGRWPDLRDGLHGRLVLKLPRERVAELIATGAGTPFDAGKGKPLAEWLALGDPDDATLLDLAREAATFVRGARGTPREPDGGVRRTDRFSLVSGATNQPAKNASPSPRNEMPLTSTPTAYRTKASRQSAGTGSKSQLHRDFLHWVHGRFGSSRRAAETDSPATTQFGGRSLQTPFSTGRGFFAAMRRRQRTDPPARARRH